MKSIPPEEILARVEAKRSDMIDFLTDLVRAESPTDVPESQLTVQRLLTQNLARSGYLVRKIPGTLTGGHLVARPARRPRGRPGQALIGHCDTVWPLGTLDRMPVTLEGGTLKGPGVYDMKGGLTQIVFALQVLEEAGVEPEVTPVVLINSDEEIGSPESRRHVALLARRSVRAYILEPALGLSGKLKTARKGGGRYHITIRGIAAHAGLDPDSGASAILELSHLIQKLHGMNDRARGITVNVGVIDGGIRPNVVAPVATAEVDVRVLTSEQARELEAAIGSLQPVVQGATLEIAGQIRRPPLEPTPRNQTLWEAARREAQRLGYQLESGTAGGGSDGNLTSRYTATLDGLGAVGDGAHAQHEFIFVDKLAERTALLASLIQLPAHLDRGVEQPPHPAAGAAGLPE